jgi:sugar phosphate permease
MVPNTTTAARTEGSWFFDKIGLSLSYCFLATLVCCCLATLVCCCLHGNPVLLGLDAKQQEEEETEEKEESQENCKILAPSPHV